MSPALRAACYVRVSTQAQTEKWGLQAQRAALKAECERHGWTIAEWFTDPGISGETIDQRPDMLRLLEATRAGRFDVVLAVEFERFSRSRHGRDWAEILGACEAGHARLAILGQQLDPSSPEDSFLGGLFGLLAAREKQKMIQRTSRGIRERVKAGKWWGSIRPFGYRIGADGKLVPDALEAAVVRRIFREIRDGATLCDVAKGLNHDHVPTHKGGREWWPTAVRRVLVSPVHAGTLVFGRHRPNPRGGPPIRVDDAHEAIVPLQEWEHVQSLVAARKRAGCPPSRWDQGYLLTGLLVCPTCGRRMHGGSSGVGKRAKTNRRYYGHVGTRVPGATNCRKVRADDVERLVLAEVTRALSGPDVAEAARRALVEERLRDGTDETRRRAELQDELAKLDRRAATLYEDRVAGVVTPEQFREWNEGTAARRAEIDAEIRRLEDRLLSLGRHADVEGLVVLLADLPATLDALTPREVKMLLWEVVREVRIGPDARVEVDLRIAAAAVRGTSASSQEVPRRAAP